MRKITLSAILLTTAIFIACSGSETITKVDKIDQPEEPVAESIYPNWYAESGHEKDSLNISMSATVTASDSVEAIKRAEKESKIQLESYISSEIEKVRSDLESTNTELVTNKEFIIALRNAQNKVLQTATVIESKSVKNDYGYCGFAKSNISKAELNQVIENGLSNQIKLWEIVQKSDVYKSLTE